MKNLEAIESELAAAKAELEQVMGTPTEVYSRIVGYYRSVRNWNKGKREEYGERKLFRIEAEQTASKLEAKKDVSGAKVLLFVRAACPACPSAKEAASKLGLPVEYVDADMEAGLAMAEVHQVMSTPTAIFFSSEGKELARARDAHSISSFVNNGVELAQAL